jgi:hypothetical protein
MSKNYFSSRDSYANDNIGEKNKQTKITAETIYHLDHLESECVFYQPRSKTFNRAIRIYRPFFACLKYAALGSLSTSTSICIKFKQPI